MKIKVTELKSNQKHRPSVVDVKKKIELYAGKSEYLINDDYNLKNWIA